jgi:hypothetical protein
MNMFESPAAMWQMCLYYSEFRIVWTSPLGWRKLRRGGSNPAAVTGGMCYVCTTFGRRRLSAANKPADTMWVQGGCLYIYIHQTYHPRSNRQTDQLIVQMHTASRCKLRIVTENHHTLVYDDGVKFFDKNINSKNRNPGTIFNFSNEINPEDSW